jgi:hypothetical protein
VGGWVIEARPAGLREGVRQVLWVAEGVECGLPEGEGVRAGSRGCRLEGWTNTSMHAQVHRLAPSLARTRTLRHTAQDMNTHPWLHTDNRT